MNSGKVQLDVVLRGKDEVTAVLAQVEKQAKDTEKQLSKMADSEASIGRTDGPNRLAAGIDKIDTAVERTAQGIEKINKVIGIAGFIGVVVAAVPAVVSFVRELFNVPDAAQKAGIAVDRLSVITRDAVDDLRKFKVERARTSAEREALEIEEKILETFNKQSEMRDAALEAERRVDPLQEKLNIDQNRLGILKQFVDETKKRGIYTRDVMNAEVEIRHLESSTEQSKRQIAIFQGQINDARKTEVGYADEIKRLEQDRLELMRENQRQLGIGLGLYESFFKGAFGGGLLPPAPEVGKQKPIGGTGPRRKTAAEIGEERTRERIESDIRTAEAMARLDKKLADQEAARVKIEEELSTLEDLQENQAILEEEIRLFGEYTDSIYSAADAFDTLSNALGKSLDLFPEIGDGFRGVQEAMQKHAEFVKANEEQVAQGFMTSAEAVAAGEESKTKAIISGSTEGLAAIGKLIGGLKAEYALRSAGELAMGFATLANPVESAGHFVAAGLFAVAAGKAAASGGGSGAGAAGADSEAPATSSSLGYGDGGGGQRTVVYNFSTLLADRQQVHRAIRDSELVGQRNGYGRRRGV